MTETRIVAISSDLRQPADWKIPIVESNGRCFELGAPECSFSAAELEASGSDAGFQLIEPVPVASSSREREVESEEPRLFTSDCYVFYWNTLWFKGRKLQVAKIIGDEAPVLSLRKPNTEVELRLLDQRGLLKVLRSINEKLKEQFLQLLQELETQDAELGNDERLRELGMLMYDLAPDQSWARSAISHLTLVALHGSQGETLISWVRAMARPWRLPESIKIWEESADGILRTSRHRSRSRRRARVRAIAQPSSTRNEKIWPKDTESVATTSTGIQSHSNDPGMQSRTVDIQRDSSNLTKR